MPVDLHRLTDSWLELESDPGVFTLLLEDFGVQGIQVEEIYDLQKPIEGPVYGFIFLFKWIEERRSRRKFLSAEECFVQDEDIVNSMFFAQQVVPNSCATHALLSVLLNCDTINLGETLTAFREYTSNMSPENKGFAIGNSPQLARAHNSHAKPEPQHLHEKSHGLSTSGRKMDAFHFVSYVPIKGHLFELDGLRPFPIDHGPWKSGQDWTEKFRNVITERLGIATRGEPYHDIRFNLMAVVPDRRSGFESKLRILKTNRKIVMEALQQLIRQTQPELLSHNDLPPFKPPSPSGGSSTVSSVQPKLPAALDSHNYAKSPLMRNKVMHSHRNDSDLSTDDEEENQNTLKQQPLKNIPTSISPLTPINVKTTSDFTTPLSIQTQMSPTFSTASSTDTSSEVGSAFNSPTLSNDVQQQVSPNSSKLSHDKEFSDIQKFVCIRVTSNRKPSHEETNEPEHVSTKCDEMVDKLKTADSTEATNVAEVPELSDNIITNDNIVEPHKFAPKDLLALLKTLETEINECEVNLRDEVDKRKRFKIDDCRRTHNYDQFITTFLSMLSEQNKLSGLIKQHCIVKRRQGIHVGRLKKSSKSDRRKRQRSRKRKS
ncbi:Ubiquitin carboxyl-terminal hydrolase BAP1 [Nymphon striatum]|nr:Ubiquitin carboxyl-terminal hydrolase BAP1 [Nymphon striatum]